MKSFIDVLALFAIAFGLCVSLWCHDLTGSIWGGVALIWCIRALGHEYFP